MVINVFCGVVSGVLSSSLANPTDVVKVKKKRILKKIWILDIADRNVMNRTDVIPFCVRGMFVL
jgi:hypothetical protein